VRLAAITQGQASGAIGGAEKDHRDPDQHLGEAHDQHGADLAGADLHHGVPGRMEEGGAQHRQHEARGHVIPTPGVPLMASGRDAQLGQCLIATRAGVRVRVGADVRQDLPAALALLALASAKTTATSGTSGRRKAPSGAGSS
jgi:hypothetical protein